MKEQPTFPMKLKEAKDWWNKLKKDTKIEIAHECWDIEDDEE